MPEVLSGAAWPIAAAALVATQSDLSLLTVPALAALWYGSEAVLAWAAGWHLTARSPLAWALRDLLLPVVWLNGLFGTGFVWRGNQMRVAESRGAV